MENVGPEVFLDVESLYFCQIEPHVKFWNPRTTFENITPFSAQKSQSEGEGGVPGISGILYFASFTYMFD